MRCSAEWQLQFGTFGTVWTVTAGEICATNPLMEPQPIGVDVEPGTAAFTITPTWYDGAGTFNGAISTVCIRGRQGHL